MWAGAGCGGWGDRRPKKPLRLPGDRFKPRNGPNDSISMLSLVIRSETVARAVILRYVCSEHASGIGPRLSPAAQRNLQVGGRGCHAPTKITCFVDHFNKQECLFVWGWGGVGGLTRDDGGDERVQDLSKGGETAEEPQHAARAHRSSLSKVSHTRRTRLCLARAHQPCINGWAAQQGQSEAVHSCYAEYSATICPKLHIQPTGGRGSGVVV